VSRRARPDRAPLEAPDAVELRRRARQIETRGRLHRGAPQAAPPRADRRATSRAPDPRPGDRRPGKGVFLVSESLPPQLTLCYKAGDLAACTIVEPTGVTIGRKDTCEVVLPSNDVSRQHAQIRVEGERWILRDLGSSNGTLVDGVVIKQHELRDGDRIKIGGFELLCQLKQVNETALIASEDSEAEACMDMRDFNALLDQVLDERAETDL